jgi:acyl carrier protein
MADESNENATITERVVKLAAEHGGVSPTEVTPAHHFINDLDYDSLTVMEFTMDLEDEFGVQIPDEVVEHIQTVGHAIDYVKEHRAA